MEFCMWANLPRHVGQLNPMRGELAHVYLPYNSRNFVTLMFFLGRNMSRKAKFDSGNTVVSINVNLGPTNPGPPPTPLYANFC